MKTYPNLLKTILVAATAALLAACSSSGKSAPVGSGYYRVKQGDTLYGVAKRYRQSVSTLASWNGLTNSAKLEVGQVLRVSRNPSSRSTTPQRSASQVSRAQTVVPTNRLSMRWPVDNGSSNIAQRFNGNNSKGIDIAGMRGQPVKAAASGKVLYVGESVRGYGKLILISHNASTITAYAHNDAVLVQKDQTVSAGQTIAQMGSSDTDSVKLHFEVRVNGKAVDPMPYLQN